VTTPRPVLCACGRPTTHPGLCKARVAERRQAGAQAPRRAKNPALADCLQALDEVHDACIRFSSAWAKLRATRLTAEALIMAHPEMQEEVPAQ
jgi:hypothetical protein